MSQTYCLNVTFLAESILIGKMNYLRPEQRKASIVCGHGTVKPILFGLPVLCSALWSVLSDQQASKSALRDLQRLSVGSSFVQSFCTLSQVTLKYFVVENLFAMWKLLTASSCDGAWYFFNLQGLTCGKTGHYVVFYTRAWCLEPLPGLHETPEQSLPPSQP